MQYIDLFFVFKIVHIIIHMKGHTYTHTQGKYMLPAKTGQAINILTINQLSCVFNI